MTGDSEDSESRTGAAATAVAAIRSSVPGPGGPQTEPRARRPEPDSKHSHGPSPSQQPEPPEQAGARRRVSSQSVAATFAEPLSLRCDSVELQVKDRDPTTVSGPFPDSVSDYLI